MRSPPQRSPLRRFDRAWSARTRGDRGPRAEALLDRDGRERKIHLGQPVALVRDCGESRMEGSNLYIPDAEDGFGRLLARNVFLRPECARGHYMQGVHRGKAVLRG